MKTNELICENSNLMYYSREIVHLKTPKEIKIIYYSILIIMLLIITSLFSVRINDVIKVKGIVRAKENSSEVKNVISGTITTKNYEANQFIKKDDILFTLNDEIFLASMNVLNTDYENINKELQCIEALIEGVKTGKNNYKNDEYIGTQIDEYLKTIAYYNKQIEIIKYQYDYQKNLPDTLKNSKTEKEAYMDYKLKQSELSKYKADFLAQLYESKKNLINSKTKIEQEIAKIKNDYSYLEIKAPVSGFIQEITMINPGDYVSANQKILKIIPTNNNDFRVQLSIPTKDIGEIKEGIEVKYRLSAFPFFEYKGAEGKVISIDPDIRETAQNQLIYSVYSDINRTSFTNYEGNEYQLRSGIEVDARIVMNKIKLISYIFRKMGYIK